MISKKINFYIVSVLLIILFNISYTTSKKNEEESVPSSNNEAESSTTNGDLTKNVEEMENSGQNVEKPLGETEEKNESDKQEKEEKEEAVKEDEEKNKEKPSEEEEGESKVESATPETSDTEDLEINGNSLPMVVTVATEEKEPAPEDTFIVKNSKGKVCLLAKFAAVFTIKYSSQEGEQKAEVTVPENAISKGTCESSVHLPKLEISWHKYVLNFNFNKTDADNSAVTSIDLTYDTSDSLFDRATNAGKVTVKSKQLNLFETPLDKSYYCPAQEVVMLYDGDKHMATARLKDIYMQAYGVEEGSFAPSHRCNKVVIDGPDVPFVQDETVPLAVGCTLAIITLIILIGFSVHRAYTAAKADYNAVP